jgi:hypothetical protein
MPDAHEAPFPRHHWAVPEIALVRLRVLAEIVPTLFNYRRLLWEGCWGAALAEADRGLKTPLRRKSRFLAARTWFETQRDVDKQRRCDASGKCARLEL